MDLNSGELSDDLEGEIEGDENESSCSFEDIDGEVVREMIDELDSPTREYTNDVLDDHQK